MATSYFILINTKQTITSQTRGEATSATVEEALSEKHNGEFSVDITDDDDDGDGPG